MAMLAAFALVACGEQNSGGGGGGQEEEPSEDPAVFDFVEKRVEIRVGENKQLSVATLYEGETITYTVNDGSVIEVDDDGIVQGLDIGTAVVKATSSYGRTALAQVTVHDAEFYPVPYFTVNQEELRLNLGDKFVLDYIFAYQGQAIEAEVSMKSSDTGVVRVSGGMLSAVGSGTANITLSGTSPYGTATKTVKVTVSATLTEFYLSLTGRDIYVGKPMPIVLYAVENGGLKQIDEVSYSISGDQIATVKNGNELHPAQGGDTTIVATFQYGGKAQEQSLPIHIYGPHTCTVKFLDGTVDNEFTATYGDHVLLKLKNADGNPEYTKAIKSWYAGDKELTGDVFVMPDEDVELTVRFVNETEENFMNQFTAGHLLNDLSSAKAEYVKATYTDSVGVSSDFGYVKLDCPNWSSVNYFFEEAVTVNAFSTVKMKMYLPSAAAIVYYGVASDASFNSANPTRRYDIGKSNEGKVPFMNVEYEKWIDVELPLSAFVNVGEKLNGISICVSSNSYVLIDYISVNYGLAATDPVYQDNVLYKAILAEANGSKAQAGAINTYYLWSIGLTDAERNTALHAEHVAEIKAILTEHFDSKIETRYENIPTASGGVFYAGDRADLGDGHKLYQTDTYEHYYMTQVNSGDYKATFTLNKYAFNRYGEVSFGMYAMTTNEGGGKLIIGNETLDFDNQAHYYRVVIVGRTLTVYVDNQGAERTAVLTVTLSDAIVNGEEELVVKYEMVSWAQVEFTEMHMVISAEDMI